MASPSNDQDQKQPYRELSAAHIRALSALNARIPAILTSAATTVSQLTNTPISPSAPRATADTVSARKDAISTTAYAFVSAVVDLGVALRSDIDDLEAQGIIPAKPPEIQSKPSIPPEMSPEMVAMILEAFKKTSETSVKNAGLGDFDVGVLNANAGVRQRDGEEVLGRVKGLLEELLKKEEDGAEGTAVHG